MAEDLEWYWFDTVERGVLIGLGPILKLQTDFQRPLTIELRFLGPHYSKRLANGVDVILHRGHKELSFDVILAALIA